MKLISLIGVVSLSKAISINSIKNPWGNGVIFNSGNINEYKTRAPQDYRADMVYEADNFNGAATYKRAR